MDYRPRLLEEKVEKYLSMDKSVVVVGPRQAGKTYLLKHLACKMDGIYVNCEEPVPKNSSLHTREIGYYSWTRPREFRK